MPTCQDIIKKGHRWPEGIAFWAMFTYFGAKSPVCEQAAGQLSEDCEADETL